MNRSEEEEAEVGSDEAPRRAGVRGREEEEEGRGW